MLIGYFVSGEFERHTNRHTYSIKASLVASITEVFTIMDRDMAERAFARFRGRIKAVLRLTAILLNK